MSIGPKGGEDMTKRKPSGTGMQPIQDKYRAWKDIAIEDADGIRQDAIRFRDKITEHRRMSRAEPADMRAQQRLNRIVWLLSDLIEGYYKGDDA